jgi:hypothetical protein
MDHSTIWEGTMFDTETIITTLYVTVDDHCSNSPCEVRPGRPASLTRSEVLTLLIFGQWRQFSSERDFYRWVQRHLRADFPMLPDRSQFNRLMRANYPYLIAFWQKLTVQLRDSTLATLGDAGLYYEAMDATAVATRFAQRRGHGWLVGQANIGHGSRQGWYCGFYLLACSDPTGVFTGFGFAAASVKDQPLATDFLNARAGSIPELPTVGHPLPPGAFYLTDSGFQGEELHRIWRSQGADVITTPQRNSGAKPSKKTRPWPELRHWIASLRQIIETAFAKLHHVFRLRDERPHTIEGFQTRLAAKFTLHNFCIYLNRLAGRPSLAFADLWNW